MASSNAHGAAKMFDKEISEEEAANKDVNHIPPPPDHARLLIDKDGTVGPTDIIITRNSDVVQLLKHPSSKVAEGVYMAVEKFSSNAFVSGHLLINPSTTKPMEVNSGGSVSFVVVSCEPDQVLVTIAGRVLPALSPSDHFVIPTKASFLIQNTSATIPARFYVMILESSYANIR